MSLSVTNTLEIRWAKSEFELRQAMEVSIDSFYPNPSDVEQRLALKSKWEPDPFFKPEFLLIALRGNEILGGIRTIPLSIMRFQQEFKCLGICEIFIAKEDQNLGIASRLVDELLKFAESTSYELILSVTRRKIDGFYLKKGFFGVGSYSQVQISDINKSLKFNESNPKPISFYPIKISDKLNMFYEDSYREVFGRRLRSKVDWKYIETKNHTEKKSSLGIWINNELVGYVIFTQYDIHELSFSPKIDPLSVIYGLSQYLGTDNLNLNISARHSMFSRNLGLDVRRSERECFYGGHVLKIINTRSIIEKFQIREHHILSGIESKIIDLSIDENAYLLDLINKEIKLTHGDGIRNGGSKQINNSQVLTYAVTKFLLGISSNFGKSEASKFGFSEEIFQISKIDEF